MKTPQLVFDETDVYPDLNITWYTVHENITL